jgi:hypothetical protein
LKVAQEVYRFLKSLELDVWFDKESLIAGQDWDRERAEAQRDADLIVLVCSQETVAREGVIQRELREIFSLLDSKPLGHVFLVAVRTDDIRLTPEIARYQYLDFFDPDWQLKLARSVELKFKQTDNRPGKALQRFFDTSQAPEPLSIKSLGNESACLIIKEEYPTYNLEGEYWSYINAAIVYEVMDGYYRSMSAFRDLSEILDLKNEWSIRVEGRLGGFF